MNKELTELIENQINKELWSAYLYLDVAEYYRSKGFDGLHKYFEAQAKEEVEHAEKFMEFLHDEDISFELKLIEGPKNHFKDLREPLVFQIEHEKVVTSLIYKIYDKAVEVKDHRVSEFLRWYINEQTEEEKTAKDLLDRYDLLSTSGGIGLLKFDKSLKRD